jgi:parvulin-like peptidyl-prolyl isomerase
LFSENENEILSLYEKIEEGSSFDSLLLQRPEYALQSEPYSVKYGQMEKEVEDSLYDMTPGEISMPVKAPNGWYIFKLISTEEKIIQDAKQAEAEGKLVMKIASATIIDSIYKEYYMTFFSDVHAETNSSLFLEFADLVINVLHERYNNYQINVTEQIVLLPDDLYKIESNLGEQKLKAEFIKLDNQPTTLDDFLQALAFEKFSVDTLDNELIKIKLNSFVKRFIEYELLAREGYRRGLQNRSDVQRYLNMWRNYYLSEVLRKNLLEDIKVSDEEAYEYFEEKVNNSNPTMQIKIIEILTESLDIIRDALKELEEGTDFRELALKYTIREEAMNNNGELGYFSVNEYGEIGRIAATLQVGEMYGPVKVPEGFSLFQLIDRKEESVPSEKSFSNLKDKIRNELKYRRFSDEIINKTVELANKYGISINQEILDSIDVLNTTTVVYRYFGFGGRLLAVPMTTPNYLWVKPWKEQEVLSP